MSGKKELLNEDVAMLLLRVNVLLWFNLEELRVWTGCMNLLCAGMAT